MSRNVPETVDKCTDKIASITNQLEFMYPNIEKTKLEEIVNLARHTEKLHDNEVSELRKELDEAIEELDELC